MLENGKISCSTGCCVLENRARSGNPARSSSGRALPRNHTRSFIPLPPHPFSRCIRKLTSILPVFTVHAVLRADIPRTGIANSRTSIPFHMGVKNLASREGSRWCSFYYASRFYFSVPWIVIEREALNNSERTVNHFAWEVFIMDAKYYLAWWLVKFTAVLIESSWKGLSSSLLVFYRPFSLDVRQRN